jgi:membrane-associated HD superfamily phosphohydrolase
MPLVPEETIRGIKHDLGVAKEGSDFNPAILDPASPEAKAAKAAKAEAAAKAKAEKETKAEAHEKEFPHASEPELHRRLDQRRRHLTQVRDELDTELDIKPQVRFVAGVVQEKLRAGQSLLNQGREVAADKISGLSGESSGMAVRWKPLAAFAGAAAVFVVLLRKLLKNP